MLLALLGVLTLGGCTQVRAALAVQPDDTVSGEVVIAAPGSTPPTVAVPADLDVEVEPYREAGFTGSRLSFSGLDFAEVAKLTSATAGGARATLGLRRFGNRVLVDGSADLAAVSADRADFQLKMTFPGEVLETDGELAARTVTWMFRPGERDDIHAVVRFADPKGPSAPLWTLLLSGLVGLACLVVVWLARRGRNPPLAHAGR